MSSLKCKQKLCGFPEEKNFNRKKVLIHKFHKNCLKWSAKRQIRSENCDWWIANSNPATPLFQGYPPFLAKFLVPPRWLIFWKVLPPLNKWGEGGVPTMINHDLKLLNIWFRENKILNTSKTEIILFRWKSQSNITKHLNFRISGQYIERISEVRYLWLILNEFLSWNTYYTLLKEIKLSNWFTFKSSTFYFSTPIKNNILLSI